MTEKTVRTRFAPSPTGFMHVGNFRTALFAYLYAKKNNGRFIIRIEDTDQERLVPGAEEAIFRVLKWAGLNHDEGPDIGGPAGPYRQSDRLAIYQKYAAELLTSGHAYHCFCSGERLNKMRGEQQARGEIIKYDRHCLNLNQDEINAKIKNGEPFVIRQKINIAGATTFHDLVRGDITIQNNTLDDSVLIKSDGYPTYNFANVIDDHLMGITHIIRGEEYVTSTAKYIQLYHAFGWEVPAHAHLSLILDHQRAKLSKRAGDVAVEDYIAKGYLPEALINFIALLGWNPGNDQELFTLDELIKEFDFDKITKSGAIFDLEKLDWMNGHYIRGKSLDELTKLCLPYLEGYLKNTYNLQLTTYNSDYLKEIIGLEQERLKKLSEIGERTGYFFNEPVYDPTLLIWKKSDPATTKLNLQFLIDYLPKIPKENWTRKTLEDSLIEEIKRQNLTNGEVLWPMRVALSGLEKSPPPFDIAEILGQEKTLLRLKFAQSKLTN